ncbi:MAG: SDR family NAD(P)-dependent oxidoreductase, partial [Acidimicrobiia bacterium]
MTKPSGSYMSLVDLAPTETTPVPESEEMVEGIATRMPRTFVVTGASRGIGLATAEKLAADGHQVVGIARSVPVRFPGEFIQSDLGDERSTERLVRRLNDRYEVDGLVNNAGMVRPGGVEEATPR